MLSNSFEMCEKNSLICQAQRWGEDLPDNKLMKMSQTYTSISSFHKRSAEHINIAAKMLSLFFLTTLIHADCSNLPSFFFLRPLISCMQVRAHCLNPARLFD